MSDPGVIVRIQLETGAVAPVYGSAQAAGADIRAWLPDGDLTIEPGAHVLVPTGIRMALPVGYEAQVRPRSGLAAKYGVTVLNSPGTIDADYRGEVKVVLINHGREPFVIHHGDRIAQMVIASYAQCVFSETAVLDDTVRGAGGFGSTGI
jgi:dUTP pyrophosphatase